VFALVCAFLFVVAAPATSHAQCAAWAPNVAYAVNAQVTYGGAGYRCQQAHTSQVGWEPPAAPSLWVPQACTGGTATPTNTPTPTARPTATATSPAGSCAIGATCEAENATRGGGVLVSTQHAGYTGTGFADYQGNGTGYVEWTVNVPTAGNYTLNIRYGNGGTGDRPMSIQVNGTTVVSSMSFPVTGWTSWTVRTQSVSLPAGAAVRIRATELPNGPNVDSLTVTGGTATPTATTRATARPTATSTTPPGTCSVNALCEAETAALGGGVVVSTLHAGYTGSGFADYQGNGTGFVEWTVSVSTAGSYVLGFRYANGGTADRPMAISVNGTTVIASLSFPVTGWTSWTVRSQSATLPAGLVRIRATELPNGPNVDSLQVTGGSFTPTAPPRATPTSTSRPTATATSRPTATSTSRPTATSTTRPTPTTAPPSGGRWLVGYWHNFDNGSGNIQLRDVSNNWDVVNVSFAEPTSPTSGDMRFTPYNTTQADFQAQVALLKSRGKRVVISIGGANGQVQLTSTGARDMFVSTMTNIIRTYGFDGLDIDFEGHSFILNQGDNNINAPTTPVLVNTIAAIRSIRTNIGSGMYLSFAPETFFVQLGFEFYGGNCLACDRRAGSYLPVLQALRNELTILHVQDYNSGPIKGLDGAYYNMGNATFHIKMTEMLLQGFPVVGTGQTFAGLPPSKVGFGVPATVNAGNGFTSNAEVQSAFSNLNSRFPGVKGIMSWSINWDQFGGFAFSNSHRQYLNGL
jgi:chitinase